MSSQVRLIKRSKPEASRVVAARPKKKNQRQGDREIAGVIKTWIEEFQVRTAERTEVALSLLNK
ncbi:MAG TPA: hypothetical protein VI306_05840 [Pyrinomonadaceae bacterium]